MSELVYDRLRATRTTGFAHLPGAAVAQWHTDFETLIHLVANASFGRWSDRSSCETEEALRAVGEPTCPEV